MTSPSIEDVRARAALATESGERELGLRIVVVERLQCAMLPAEAMGVIAACHGRLGRQQT
jgi:hypothetical protein